MPSPCSAPIVPNHRPLPPPTSNEAKIESRSCSSELLLGFLTHKKQSMMTSNGIRVPRKNSHPRYNPSRLPTPLNITSPSCQPRCHCGITHPFSFTGRIYDRGMKTTGYHGLASDTRVGAIRLFFAWPLAVEASSFSLSLASLLIPAAKLLWFAGVSGGVVIGTPVTLPDCAAAIPGMVPPISGGLFTTLEDCVAMEEVEFDRVGDGGRAPAKEPVAGGEGAANELAEFRCW